MDCENNICEFCGELTEVSRNYFRVKNKHFDDNKKGKYSSYIYYCDKCGIKCDQCDKIFVDGATYRLVME